MLALLACADEDEAPPLELTTPCEGTPPTVVSLDASDGGAFPGEGGGEVWTVLFVLDLEDEDRDIDEVSGSLWWAPAGTDPDVATTAAFDLGAKTLYDESCFTGRETDRRYVALGTRTGPAFDTAYTFAITVTDAHGYTSDPAYVDWVTCREDGTPGG
jgi:hypothetical protein